MKGGYLKACLVGRDGALKNVQIGRLVLMAFHGQPKKGQECSHLNDEPADNRLENLAWETRKSNSERRQIAVGSEAGRSVLSDEDVRLIRSSNLPQRDIAAEFGISQSQVSHIRSGLQWRHL